MAAAKKATEYVRSKTRIKMTPGEMVKTLRELQEMTQAELASASGVPQPAISGLEGGTISLGVGRAERLARALRVHPSVLLWPQWDEDAAPATGGHASRKRRAS
jgi:transcriptional regulator with XRE-family HTH domain